MNNTYKPNNKEELDIELEKYFDWWFSVPKSEKFEIMKECGISEENRISHDRFFRELNFLDKKRIFEYYSEYKINKALNQLKGE